MNILLEEYLSYISDSNTQAIKQARAAKLKPIGRTGYWSPTGQKPATASTRNNTFTVLDTSGEPVATPTSTSAPTPTQQQTPAVQDTPQVSVGSTEDIESVQDSNPTVQAAKIGGTDPSRPNDIVQGIFSKTITRKLGPNQTDTDVRDIIDPTTGKPVDVSTVPGRARAVEILTERLDEFHKSGKIAEVCDALADTATPTGVRTNLRKWLGTLGELGGLRDMLASGHESYLYADSNPKNDIVSLINCGDESKNTRNIKVVAVSTKSTSGKSAGRIDASGLVYIMDSVAGKMYNVPGRGRDFSFKAENVAQALFGMQKRIYSTATRTDIVRGPRFGGSERKIAVSSDRKRYYDSKMLAQAERENKEAKSANDPGGQRSLMAARKITEEEVKEWFANPKNPTYQKLLSDMSKIMDGNSSGAETLIGLMRSRLERRVRNSPDFRLTDFDDWMTDEISNLIDAPDEDGNPSELVFESDMMISTFNAEKGYVGCVMVNGETMTERVREKYPELESMSTRDKLRNILGWKNNPRGIGLDTKEGGYVDPQQRAIPPLKMLKKQDFKTIDGYAKAVCKEETDGD